MDLSTLLSYIPLWSILLVVAIVLLYIYLTAPYTVWSKLNVDGPSPSLFFGNAGDLGNYIATIDAWKNKYGRVFGAYVFRTHTLVVCDLDFVKRIFIKDFNTFTNRWFIGGGKLQQPIIKKGLFFEDGVDWKRIRKIVTPTFSSGKLKLVSHHLNTTARYLGDSLVDYAKEKRPAEAKTVFGSFALDAICGSTFGLDINSQNNYEAPFIKKVKELFTFGKLLQVKVILCGIFPPVAHIFHQLGIGFFDKDTVEFFEKNISALVSERKSNPELQTNMDYLQLLLNAEAEPDETVSGANRLTTKEITAQGIMFIIAGYETTSSTLQFVAYEIAKRPEVQEALIKEIVEVVGWEGDPTYEQCQGLKYMEAVISESLRFTPPVHILQRRNEEEIVINNVTIPAQTYIMIPIANIMRDPEYFPDPNEFKPERFLNDENQRGIMSSSFMPFGLGPRQCIGMRLAMMEVKIALVHALRRVEFVGVEPENLELEGYAGLLVPKVPVKLHLKCREKSFANK